MLLPDSSRVIIRPFIPGNEQRVTTVIGRALALSEDETERELKGVRAEFSSWHLGTDGADGYRISRSTPTGFHQRPLSRARRLLLGALFSGEYALESAALLNAIHLPHPDQAEVRQTGALRFIMSLRATGEGHLLDQFRSGVIAAGGEYA